MYTNTPLLTDQYQLVMAYGYWRHQKAEQEAVYHLFFRSHPFKGQYTICCGLARAIQFLNEFRFTDEDCQYLTNIKRANGEPLFESDFLQYLQDLRFSCDVDAIPEGTVVFPHEPLLRIKGPLLQCQLLETALINLIHFSSLIATKAARVCQAAQGDPVTEFGTRRAQGPDGAVMASRAAYIGGCGSVSNVLAGKLYDIPIKGTQAHSWIMAYDNELHSFEEFANTLKSDTILLVDTYHTIDGVKNAITVAKAMKQRGEQLAAIRLDSGDQVVLSKQARSMLDKAGFTETKIFSSGDLDEYVIADMKKRGAKIDAWGVGTRLATAHDDPALNLVYKLSAIKDNNQWQYKLKISDQSDKTTSPGIQQVRRYSHKNKLIKDVIYDQLLGIDNDLPTDADASEDLLIPIFQQGKYIYDQPSIHQIRDLAIRQVNHFLQSQQTNYQAILENKLASLKNKLITS